MPIVVKTGECQGQYFQETNGYNYKVSFDSADLRQRWYSSHGKKVVAEFDMTREWLPLTLVAFRTDDSEN